jgi:hypothetical protein
MSTPLQGLVVSVQYDDMLALTLPYNTRHFDKIYVITAPFDEPTKKVASKFPNVEVIETDLFYQNDAVFNKGAAMEMATGRLDADKWTIIFDADIIMPPTLPLPLLQVDNLYSPWRYNVERPDQLMRATATVPFNVSGLPRLPDGELAGYFQLFHPRASALKKRPWYGTRWKHAGGCDSDFMRRFMPMNRIRMDFYVLHLGITGANWHGRATARWSSSLPAAGVIDPSTAKTLQEQMFQRRKENRGVHESEFVRGQE